MTASDVELKIHRANTKRFIDSDPTEIALIPSVATKVAGTVKFTDAAPRDSQTFKIIWNSDSTVQRKADRVGGDEHLDFVLLGEFTASVAVGDHFEHGGNRYDIRWIAPPNGYELKSGGVCYGPHPDL